MLVQFANFVPQPFYWLDREQHYLGMNRQGLRITGTRSFEKDFAGKTPMDLYPEHMAKEIVAHHRSVIQTGKELCTEETICDFETKQSKTFSVRIAPLYDASGYIIGTCGISVEITEQKARMDRLYSHITALQQFADMLPEPCYWLDLAQRYKNVNQSFMVASGEFFRGKVVLGSTPLDLFPEVVAKDIIAHHKEVIEKGKILCFEEPVLELSTKEQKVFRAMVAPLRDKKGCIIGTCGISIDITQEHKSREQSIRQLVEAKEHAEVVSRVKSEFIANMGHDIRTPITGMLMLAQHMLHVAEKQCGSLKADAADAADAAECARVQLVKTVQEDAPLLIQSTDALLQLCNGILDVAQLESGKVSVRKQAFDLRTVLQRTVTLLLPVAHSKQLALSHKIYPSVPVYLHGAKAYLERILLNLVSNALKFTETGRVVVSVALSDTLDAPAASGGPTFGEEVMLRITVEDTGVGIAPDKQAYIFGYFSRLAPSCQGKYKGTGLGLYTVKQYVTALGGNIRVDSEQGQGSCFVVMLPMTVCSPEVGAVDDNTGYVGTASQPAAVPSFSSSTADASSVNASSVAVDVESAGEVLHVLIVEDNHVAARGLQYQLQQLHCHVDCVNSGEHAILRLKKADHAYQLVLMDIGLSDMTGVEVTQAIRRLTQTRNACVPIVAVSGHAGSAHWRGACWGAGIQAVLNKPVALSELRSVLNTYARTDSSVRNGVPVAMS